MWSQKLSSEIPGADGKPNAGLKKVSVFSVRSYFPLLLSFTARQALHQVIEASRDSVVLVFLQDVHDYRLSRTLFLRRGMLRPCCVLYWPVHKERVAAFHQKLLIALCMTNRLQD